MIIHLKKRKNTLYLYFNRGKREIYISTGIRFDGEIYRQNRNQNRNHNRTPDWRQNRGLNPALKTYEGKIEQLKFEIHRAIAQLEVLEQEVTPDAIKKIVFGVEDIRPILDIFDEWYKNRQTKVSKATLKKNYQLRDKLKRFEIYDKRQMDINKFSQQDFERFKLFLYKKDKLKDNGVAVLVATLHNFLTYANPDGNYKFVKFKEWYETVIYLYPDEQDVLRKAKLTGYLDRIRDLFLIGTLTGLRYSDYPKLNLRNQDDNVIEVIQSKTSRKAYIPNSNALQMILEKYGGDVPKLSNQKANVHLKDLFKILELDRPVVIRTRIMGKVMEEKLPLFDCISTHVARKTFIMNMIRKNVHIQTIMEMSGHSDYRSMRPYLSADHTRLEAMRDKLDEDFS